MNLKRKLLLATLPLALGLSVRPVPQLPFDLAVERRLALVEGQRDRHLLGQGAFPGRDAA